LPPPLSLFFISFQKLTTFSGECAVLNPKLIYVWFSTGAHVNVWFSTPSRRWCVPLTPQIHA
jgi:hypothetical protein